jgi:hypothetical protein
MQLTIDRDALELTFRTLLTCRCPVTEDEEQAIFEILESTPHNESINYNKVLEIFPSEANTVFSRLADFSVWQAPTGVSLYCINRDHVIRHFASSYHWDQVVAQGLVGSYKKVKSIPSWFMGHMLLPSRVVSVEGETATASYEYEGGNIMLTNLFAPKMYNPKPGEIWAVHFAGLLGPLSVEEQKTAILMIESNNMLVNLREEITEIDYHDYERYIDYRAFCEERHQKYYGGKKYIA